MPRALPLSVFCSYADTDKRYVERLQKHVTLLVKDGLITAWTRQMIEAGKDWDQEVHSHLQAADIVLPSIGERRFHRPPLLL